MVFTFLGRCGEAPRTSQAAEPFGLGVEGMADSYSAAEFASGCKRKENVSGTNPEMLSVGLLYDKIHGVVRTNNDRNTFNQVLHQASATCGPRFSSVRPTTPLQD